MQFSPSVNVRVSEHYYGRYSDHVRDSRIQMRFKTYAELKKHIKTLLKDSYDDVVYVNRSRRGEWGEWFERWEIVDGKPVITKKGWL